MSAVPADLREIPGRSVARKGVGVREWSVGWGLARQLMSRHIVAVGMSYAQRGFAYARKLESQGVVMACLDGAGYATVGGQAVRFAAGMVYRMPVHEWQAYWSAEQAWQLLWICYAEGLSRPRAILGTTEILSGDGRKLGQVAEALKAEVEGARSTLALDHLSELVDIYAKELAGRRGTDTLRDLWVAVEADLAREWTLGDLARLSGLGEESLRLQCLEETGHSPIAQVTALRMRRAAVLLAHEHASVARVSEQVGYANPFSFSTSFKRWMNMSPAVYQGRRRGNMVLK